MVTVKDVIDSVFQFRRGDGSVISNTVYLLAGGKVFGPNSLNEYSWSFDQGELMFHDDNGNVTTKFRDVDLTDGLKFSGFFKENPDAVHILEAYKGGRNHGRLLEILPRKEKQKPMLILIRSHLVNNKLYDMVSRFSHANDWFDVAIVYDRTHGTPSEMPDAEVIWHSAAECLAMGLPATENRLLWWCGDYPFYFALNQRPNYQYYAMVEYDVHFTDDPIKFFTDLVSLLKDRENGDRIDALGPRFRLEDGTIGLHAAMRRKYDLAYSYFFPLIVLSKAAVSFLHKQRVLDAALKTSAENIGHCESFVPSELVHNGFYCADLNVLVPQAYDNDLMILPVPFGLPVSMADGFEGRVRFIHPVYGDEQYLMNLLGLRKSSQEIRHFIGALDSAQYARIPAETRASVKEDALKRLEQLS